MASPNEVTSSPSRDLPRIAHEPPDLLDVLVPLPVASNPSASVDSSPSAKVEPGDRWSEPSEANSGWAGRILVFLVCVLALFLASFPARNSDLWMHLAEGRQIAHGSVGGGSGAAAGTWLYDLVSYGLFSVLGGASLVFVKALLAVGIALLVLRLSRAGQEVWLPAICTALALLAMSSRLLLQPVTLSYFFLALALWLLWERRQDRGIQRLTFLPPWSIVLLFVVWVNADPWFMVGLGTVALVWLGQGFDELAHVRQGQGKSWPAFLVRRGSAFVLLAAACLLNPNFQGAFGLDWSRTADASMLGSSWTQIASRFEGPILSAAARARPFLPTFHY